MPGEEPEDEDIAPIIFNYLNNSREKQNRQAHGTERGSGRDQRGGPRGGWAVDRRVTGSSQAEQKTLRGSLRLESMVQRR